MTLLLIVSDWFSSTWSCGDFWRSVSAGLIGVFVPALIGWLFALQRKRHRETERKHRLEEGLFAGLVRNLICIQQMREIIKKHGASPETEIALDHMDHETLKSVEAVYGEEAHGALLDAQFALRSLMKLTQTMMSVERDNWLVQQMTGGVADGRPLDPYVAKLLDPDPKVGRLVQAEETVMSVLKLLNQTKLEKTLAENLV